MVGGAIFHHKMRVVFGLCAGRRKYPVVKTITVHCDGSVCVEYCDSNKGIGPLEFSFVVSKACIQGFYRELRRCVNRCKNRTVVVYDTTARHLTFLFTNGDSAQYHHILISHNKTTQTIMQDFLECVLKDKLEQEVYSFVKYL